ncbi:hypothetical protein SQ11_13440 [Nitrosospira sp. NpAV]|nr:hypothetical protein SQ11_13440 [Nitrosospira sp. NpAV]
MRVWEMIVICHFLGNHANAGLLPADDYSLRRNIAGIPIWVNLLMIPKESLTKSMPIPEEAQYRFGRWKLQR